MLYPFTLPPSWFPVLEAELGQSYLQSLAAFVARERKVAGKPVYPPPHLTFNALRVTPYEKVRVVVVGQDPYHGPGQAHGLSFSVPKGVKQPPSLVNIFKELESDMGFVPPESGSLLPWAEQGVLLLNATLTVRAGEPKSHHGRGWELFTDQVLAAAAKKQDPIVFLLWGKVAQEKFERVQLPPHHAVLTAAHPSPFSVHQGFFGCRHFSKVNAFFQNNQTPSIDWSL